MKKIFAIALFLLASFCSFAGAQYEKYRPEPPKMEQMFCFVQTAPEFELAPRRDATLDRVAIVPRVLPVRSTKARIWSRKTA